MSDSLIGPSRRLVLSSVVIPLAACTAVRPDAVRPALALQRVGLLAPRIAPAMTLNVSPWALPISGEALAREQAQINGHLPGWRDRVVRQFSDALVLGLRGGVVDVSQAGEDLGRGARVALLPLLRSHLAAGFVYKTFASPAYAPYVQVVLELESPGGAVAYRQLYVASLRPFNPLMKSIPASGDYLLDSVDTLAARPGPALEALGSLAEQLGRRFATDLLA